MPMGVTIRVVGFDDLDARTSYDLWRLRQQVFVVEQASPYPDLDGRDLDPATRHLLAVAEDEDRLVGCARVLGAAERRVDPVRVGRVAVVPAARGQGVAAAMVDVALDLAEGREVRLDAQTGLRDWYARWGFAVDGPEFVEDGVPHLPMVRRAASPD